MTFKVRTPPSTRTVSLWGSWDNFNLPYPMARDSRIGPEHWSGCHSFSNIICDGTPQTERQPRDGGLKMGGTYWYYYKLDDDIEFHNSAEPATTHCPLLPGQLVNVLNVPVALSGNRSRNTSVSSTSSDIRTMNPDDKYINPRPVPKPQLPRLRTSPTLPQDLWPSQPISSAPSSRAGRSATSSGPSSASTLRFRSKSPGSAFSGSIRSAFRTLRTPRSRSPESRSPRSAAEESLRGKPVTTPQQYTSSSSRDPSPSTVRIKQRSADRDLPLRRPSSSSNQGSPVEVTSFEQHRRQRSRSREPSSLRNSLVLDSVPPAALVDLNTRHYQPLSALKEVASLQNTPAYPTTASKSPPAEQLGTANLEKRLPTLPNTPSSAYPPSTIFSESVDIDILQSHFSSTTIDDSGDEEGVTTPDSMRFSNWSASYASTDHSSYYAESLIDEEPMSALLSSRSVKVEKPSSAEPPELPPRQPNMATAISSSSMSTASSVSAPPSPSGSTMVRIASSGSQTQRKTSESSCRFQYQHYRLPVSELGSEVTIKSPQSRREGAVQIPSSFELASDTVAAPLERSAARSAAMQQLMDELSYLGGMIHQR
jgi:hypothetical protein